MSIRYYVLTFQTVGAFCEDHDHAAKSSNHVASAARPIVPLTGDNAVNNAHFINITDTLSMNDTMKTEVRVQVMRDYHRRRKQRGSSSMPKTLNPRVAPSAQSQTQKFRLNREKILRHWVRVKPYVGRKAQKALAKSDAPPSAKSNGVAKTGSASELDVGHQNSQTTLLGENPDKIQSPELQPATDLPKRCEKQSVAAEQQSRVATIPIFQNPAPGVLDPFSAMSLLITPRTQVLLHHYCKSQAVDLSFQI